jgi:Alpha-kinase family
MATRYCTDCNKCLTRDCFSKTQWSKGLSRCSSCIHGTSNAIDPSQTARQNNATSASFNFADLNKPFASGNFRWVAKGVYTEGHRAGQQCVCKWFKTGGVMEAHFYTADIAASNEAVVLITKWNTQRLINGMVKVNLPQVWTFASDSPAGWAGRKILQEPFIEAYQKFNSNTGWSDDSLPWPRVMQALSHFTYHTSDGNKLLCDLQGGVYKDGIVLTDPVVMSRTREFGPTDLGANGISSFFAHHKCNEFCRSEWRKPQNCTTYYPRTAGTTMVNVPTRHSRAPMTNVYGY